MSESVPEFDEIVAAYRSGEAEGKTADEWREEWQRYSHNDPAFRAEIIDKLVELTGVKTAREFFDGEA